MIDYDVQIKKLNEKRKKINEKKKENEERIALKIGTKILKDFNKKIKESGKPLTDILGVEKITNAALVSYVLSCYSFCHNDKNIVPSQELSYDDFLNKFALDFAEKYHAADVLEYADINQIIQLGVLLSRAIGRPADMQHVEKYLLRSGANKYIQNLGIEPDGPEGQNG